MILFFLSFDGDKINGNAEFFPLSVPSVTFRQGLPKAMHFTLDGKGVFVYTLRPKDNFLICLRHFRDHFRADRAHNLAVRYTSKVGSKDILESVFLIPHATDDVLIQNIGHEIRFQSAGIDYLFVVFADVFEHILDAVRDFIGIIDRRKIASPEPLVEETVLYTLFPSVPLGAVILMFFQLARHGTFRDIGKCMEMQSFSQFSALPCTDVPPIPPRRKMIQCVHQRFAESFFCMLFGIERVSAKEIPTVGVPAPYHPLVPFPAVSAKPFKVFFHKLFRLTFVPEHGRKLLQQLCLAILAFAIDFFKVAGMYAPSVLFSLILKMAFPFLVILLWRKVIFKDRLFQLTFLQFIMGLLITWTFVETGKRASHGNFGWGNILASSMLWIFCVVFYVRELTQNREAIGKSVGLKIKFGVPGAVLLWHFLAGAAYYWQVLHNMSGQL